MLKIFNKADNFAIATDAKDEKSFIEDFSELLSFTGRVERLDSSDLYSLLQEFVEICNRYRGYKNRVQAKTVLNSQGFVMPEIPYLEASGDRGDKEPFFKVKGNLLIEDDGVFSLETKQRARA